MAKNKDFSDRCYIVVNPLSKNEPGKTYVFFNRPPRFIAEVSRGETIDIVVKIVEFLDDPAPYNLEAKKDIVRHYYIAYLATLKR